MNDIRRFFGAKVYLALGGLIVLTLFILACGDDAPAAAPAPAAPAATATPIPDPTATPIPKPTATQAPAAVPAKPAAPAATATPKPVVKEVIPEVAKVPVSPRLTVAVAPPAVQATMAHQHSQTSEKMMPIYDHLVGRHYQKNVEQPELATDWTVTPDGKTWTWNLRDDVPFIRNGKPTEFTFGAKDVVLAFNLLTGAITELSDSPGTWGGRLGYDDSAWVIESPSRIKMILPKISLDLPFLLSDEWETGIPSKDWFDAVGGEEGYMADPVGTGPWSFLELDLNVYVLHERVENHWRKTPEFHQLEMLFVKEASTRLAMLITGEAHIVNLPRDLRGQAEANGMVTAKSTLPGSHPHLRIPYYQPENYCPGGEKLPRGRECGPTPGYDPDDPMRSPKVRLALNYAIDRAELNCAFFVCEGFPLVDYFPPWREDFVDAWAPYPGPEGKTGAAGGWPYPYDVEAAKQLLVEAGFPNGFETQLWYSISSRTVPEQPDLVVAIANYWAEIGIDTKLVPFDGSLTRRARGADVSNWSFFAAPSLDPICVAPAYWWRDGGVGYREWPEISTFKHACDATADPKERLRLANDFGTWWLENAISVPLFWVFNEGTINPEIVAEYKVNLLHMGPIRYHEYTKAVFK